MRLRQKPPRQKPRHQDPGDPDREHDPEQDRGDHAPPDPDREAERALRLELGIETLSEGEELIDDATFAHMYVRLAAGGLADAAERETERGFEDSAEAELLLEEMVTVVPFGLASRAPVDAPPESSAALSRLERALFDAPDRSALAHIALRIARHNAEAAALFVVNRGTVAGLRGSGGGLEGRVEGIMVPQNCGGLLMSATQRARPARCDVPGHPADRFLLDALGRSNAREVAILPIRIGPRVVNLLYVDNAEEMLAETGFLALRALCGGIGQVYARLLRARKAEAGA